MKPKLALLCILGLTAGADALACYTVYGRDGRLAYQGETPPVDMSRPLHEALERTYPGGHMVFDSSDCGSTGTTLQAGAADSGSVTYLMGAAPATNVMGAGAAPRSRAATVGATPLLTDRRTAAALKLPYTVMSGEIVMVPAEAAVRIERPGVTVVPANPSGLPRASATTR